MEDSVIHISLKGEAALAAIDAGLLPRTDNGWRMAEFDRFWKLFEPDLCKEIDEETNYLAEMLYQERKQRADECTEKRIKKLKSTVEFLFGVLLSFLAYFIIKCL